jgi:hypothetical protein
MVYRGCRIETNNGFCFIWDKRTLVGTAFNLISAKRKVDSYIANLLKG